MYADQSTDGSRDTSVYLCSAYIRSSYGLDIPRARKKTAQTRITASFAISRAHYFALSERVVPRCVTWLRFCPATDVVERNRIGMTMQPAGRFKNDHNALEVAHKEVGVEVLLLDDFAVAGSTKHNATG